MWRRAVIAAALLALASAGCSEAVVFDTDDQWDDPTDWPGVGAGLIMATNSGDDTLSFLDPTTLEPVFRAPTGRIPAEREGPHHGAVSADGRHYYVGISNFVPGSGSGPHGSHGNGTVDGYLLEYDLATNTKVAEIRVDRSPGDVRLSGDGNYVLQSHFDLQSILDAVANGEDPAAVLSRLAVIDADTLERIAMIPVCPAGHGIASSADGSEVYVACWGSDELAVVSLAEPITADNSVDRYPVGAGGGDIGNPTFGPYAISVDPATGEVWVSNLEGKSMVVFDPSAREFDNTRATTLPGSAYFSTFTADGSSLLVPMQNPDGLARIDPTDATTEVLFVDSTDCLLPHGVIIMPDTTKAALVCEGDHVGSEISPGQVVRLAIPGTGVPTVEASFAVGVFPDDLVYLPPES